MQKNITGNYVVKRNELDHIGQTVLRRRKQHSFTQAQLAKKAKVSESYISAIENKSVNALSRSKLINIAKALKAETRDLIGRPPRKPDVYKLEDHDPLIPLDQTSVLFDTDPTTIELELLRIELARTRKFMLIALVLSGALFAVTLITFIWG